MIKIQITQDDIDKGKKMDPSNCPLALAIKRQLNPVSVKVSPWCAVITNTEIEGAKRYGIVDNGFVKRFDRGYEIRPTTVELIGMNKD